MIKKEEEGEKCNICFFFISIYSGFELSLQYIVDCKKKMSDQESISFPIRSDTTS